MKFETYEKCRTIESIDRILDFMETYEFQDMIRKAREATENWDGDVYERGDISYFSYSMCKATLDEIKTLLLVAVDKEE